MIITLFCFLATALIFSVFGKSFIFYLDKNKSDNYNIFDSFFIGLCVVGAILNIWSVFLPTNIWSLVFIILITLFLIYKNNKLFVNLYQKKCFKIKRQKTFTVIILITLIVFLFYSVVVPRSPDTFLYHIGAIQWNEFYSVVPGLANFHDRLGFNSSLFTLSAGFSFSAIYNQYLFIINSLSFLVFFIWLVTKIYFKKGFDGFFALLFLYYFILEYAIYMSSPATDMLPNLYVGYVLLSLLFYKESLDSKSIVYIVLPLYCITLKLSTVPILIVCFFALFTHKKTMFQPISKLVLYGCLFVLPWLVRNVILSGYLIFPMSAIDIFSFDWKVPKEKVLETQGWIYSFGKVPFKYYVDVLKMPLKEWFPIWWNAALLKNKILYILALTSPLIYGVFRLFNKKDGYSFLVFVVAYISSLIWLFTAPDIRFSASFIIILALTPLFLLKSIVERHKKIFNYILIGGFVYVFFIFAKMGYSSFDEDYNIKKIGDYIYLPVDVSEIKDDKFIKYNEFNLTTPSNIIIKIYSSVGESQTYDKFPCTVNFLNRCALKGEDLQDGFDAR